MTSIGSYAFYGCESLTDVYYSGSEADWNSIDIGSYNEDLTNADIHYNSNGPEADEVVITDKNTDISVTIKNEAELSVKKLTDNESIGKANAVLESGEKLDSLFDISLTKDGTAVQPDGTAMVKIPTDNENAKVYRIEDNGTKTDMNAVYSDGYMVFTTEHFSLYALVVPKDTVVIIGDVDGNGTIDVSDATAIQKMVAGSITFTPDQMSVADVNNDGEVSVIDVTLIQKYAAGVITEF